MKNVMLLGDSIRMLYEPLVKEALNGRANVYGPNDNGRWAGYTLNSLRFWMPYMPVPEIVHWNNGLWDMGDDYRIGRRFCLPEEYESCLDRTVVVLRQLCGENVKIIMATTTPTKGNILDVICQYNEVLRGVAAKYDIEVNDLYSEIIGDLENNVRDDDRIHLTPKGTELASKKVVSYIEKYL